VELQRAGWRAEEFQVPTAGSKIDFTRSRGLSLGGFSHPERALAVEVIDEGVEEASWDVLHNEHRSGERLGQMAD
jgi:hypothetical protein